MAFLRSQANLGRELGIHIYTHYNCSCWEGIVLQSKIILAQELGIVFLKSLLTPAEGGLFTVNSCAGTRNCFSQTVY
jgi:hypothetical protein